MRINHNISSYNTQRQLSLTTLNKVNPLKSCLPDTASTVQLTMLLVLQSPRKCVTKSVVWSKLRRMPWTVSP